MFIQVIDYVRVIHHLLRPGGMWINQGPLLYHWTTDSEGNQDDRYSRSIEVRTACYRVIRGFLNVAYYTSLVFCRTVELGGTATRYCRFWIRICYRGDQGMFLYSLRYVYDVEYVQVSFLLRQRYNQLMLTDPPQYLFVGRFSSLFASPSINNLKSPPPYLQHLPVQ
jgi:hypothetical protein